MSSAPVVDLIIEHDAWAEALPDLAVLAETAAHLALEGTDRAPEGHEIALLACNDSRIAQLNAEFRGKPVPTNVLSWPAYEGSPPRPAPAGPPIALGDVALAYETAAAEASAIGLPLKHHAIHLILHGCLHLLGFDHATEGEADQMEGIETRALARLGIEDPYSRRDAPGAHPD